MSAIDHSAFNANQLAVAGRRPRTAGRNARLSIGLGLLAAGAVSATMWLALVLAARLLFG